MRVPLLDLKAQMAAIREPLLRAVEETILSGQWILGRKVETLEKELAGYLSVAHAVGVASGTDALILALRALRVGRDDEVVLPTYSFFATAGAVVNVGARPVFAEMEDDSFNLDPARLEERLTPRTKAVIVVHLYGQTGRMGPILEICRSRGIPVIEDAAQAIGATHGDRPVGGLGDLGCFSFYPTKNLGGAGDGGLVTTQSAELAERVRLLRNHGMQPRYVHHEVGYNSRLDSVQAAILSVKLPLLDQWAEGRAVHAAAYREGFRDLPEVRCPVETGLGKHIYNQFVVRLRTAPRDAVRAKLAEKEIGTEIYYPIALHQQPCFKSLGYAEGSFPLSEEAARTSLALPIYPEMTREQRDFVIASLREAVRA